MNCYKIVIADDHPVVRHGIVSVLKNCEDFKVVAEASTGKEAIEMCLQQQPDILLLDLFLPEMDGLDVIKQLKKKNHKATIVMLSMCTKEEFIKRLKMIGMISFISKTEAIQDYPYILRSIMHSQDDYLSREIYNILMRLKDNDQTKDNLFDVLIIREKQILRMVIENHSSKEIGDLLNIKKTTVDRHRANIMKKLNVHSKKEMADLVREKKLIITTETLQ